MVGAVVGLGCETTTYRNGKVVPPEPPPRKVEAPPPLKLPDPAPESKKLMDTYITEVGDLGNVLKKVKDPAAARAALPETQRRVTSIRSVANRIESLPEEQRVLLGTKYSDKLIKALNDFDNTARPVRENPQLLSIMEPALSRLPALGF